MRENIFILALKASILNKVASKTELIAPKISPAVAGLRVTKASFTICDDLNLSMALAINKMIITGPVINDIVAKMPPKIHKR